MTSSEAGQMPVNSSFLIIFLLALSHRRRRPLPSSIVIHIRLSSSHLLSSSSSSSSFFFLPLHRHPYPVILLSHSPPPSTWRFAFFRFFWQHIFRATNQSIDQSNGQSKEILHPPSFHAKPRFLTYSCISAGHLQKDPEFITKGASQARWQFRPISAHLVRKSKDGLKSHASSQTKDGHPRRMERTVSAVVGRFRLPIPRRSNIGR